MKNQQRKHFNFQELFELSSSSNKIELKAKKSVNLPKNIIVGVFTTCIGKVKEADSNFKRT